MQAAEIREAASAYSKKMMEFYDNHSEDRLEISKLRRDGDRELAERISEAYYKKQAELQAEMTAMGDALLLPEQMKRFKQVLRQRKASRENPFRDVFGTPLALVEELELTPEEKTELTRVIEEVRSEYYSKIDELKRTASQKILKSLSLEQQERFEEAVGEYYDPLAQSRVDNDERRKKYEEMRARSAELIERAKIQAEAAKAAREKEASEN